MSVYVVPFSGRILSVTEAVEVALIVFGGTTVTVAGQIIIAKLNRGLLIAHRTESREEHDDTKKSIQEYQKEVNGKMDQFIETERKVAHRQGKEEGIAEATAKRKRNS